MKTNLVEMEHYHFGGLGFVVLVKMNLDQGMLRLRGELRAYHPWGTYGESIDC